MYKSALDKLLPNYNLKSILLYGEEPYFIESYSKKIANIISSSKENRLIFYFDEYEFKDAKRYLQESSLFGDINLLIIKHDKNLSKKELDSLIDICNKNQNSFFIYELYSNSAKNITKSFSKKKKADFVRFFKPNLYEATNIVKEFTKKRDIHIDEYSINHLLLSLDLNIKMAINELEKISIVNKNINKEDIDRLIYPLNSLNLEKFYVGLLNKKPILKILKQIEDEEINETRVILGLENFLRQLFLFHSYIKINGNFNSKEVLGYKLPPSIEKERVSLAIKLKQKNFLEIFKVLQDSELKLKTISNIDKKALLFSRLIKIQALLW